MCENLPCVPLCTPVYHDLLLNILNSEENLTYVALASTPPVHMYLIVPHCTSLYRDVLKNIYLWTKFGANRVAVYDYTMMGY